jgi:hypothetical protein
MARLGVTDLYDPEQSMRVAADYLVELFERHCDVGLVLMIYNGQHVIPGAVFYHDFILQNVSRLEVGALAAALSYWQAYGGIIGGSSRIGHGKLDMSVYAEGVDFLGENISMTELAREYREHTRMNAGRINEWLNEVFPVGGNKSAKDKHAPKNAASKMDLLDASASLAE